MRKLNSKIAAAKNRTRGGGRRELGNLKGGLLVAAVLAATAAANAQTTSPTAPAAPADESLTWHGITLYGIVDMDLQYESHGAPFSNYFISGGSDIVQKNSNNAVSGLTSNGMSQSRVGLQGKQATGFMDWSGVFKVETYFNPASGQITDALKSVTQNNGRSLADQGTNIDSSIAGQPFEQAFVGFSSPTWGTITFGRQNSTLADLIAKYDPQQTSYAFSLLGLSGTPAGGGDTQDRRLDGSIKYVGNIFNMVHVGLQYKTQGSSAENYATGGTGEAFSAFEVSLGAEYAGASADVFYTKVKDAVSVSTLSAAQVGELPALGLSSQNSVSGTISDNASFGVMASYVDQLGTGIRRHRRLRAGSREQHRLCRCGQDPAGVLGGGSLCGHTAIHRRGCLLRGEAKRLCSRRRCQLLERRERQVQRTLQRDLGVARLSLQQALRLVCGRHVVERVARTGF